MVSRKLLALDFVKRYFAEWGASPSLGEIAAALSVSKQRADELVRQLEIDGHLRRTPGKARGLVLAEQAGQVSQADALLRLRMLGWVVLNGNRAVMPDKPGTPLTNEGLPGLPELDHDPDWPAGGQDRATR